MASILNSKKNHLGANTAIVGQWENVKDYTSVVVTINCAMICNFDVQWAHTNGRNIPTDNDIVATRTFAYTTPNTAVTKQWDHRGTWFRITCTPSASGTVNYQTLYKKAPTELKIVDDDANIVDVNSGQSGNSLYTVLTDSNGDLLQTTNSDSNSGAALFTHLADSTGRSLATTNAGNGPESLFVSLRDASNVGFSSTGADAVNNALYVRPGDVNGNAQASTFKVKGASGEGVALYGALADNAGYQITTTNTATGLTGHNALYVHLTDETGESIHENNPLSVVNVADTVGAKPFDIASGVRQTFIVPNTDMSATTANQKINLYNLFIYNDSQVTAWVKVYDIAERDLNGMDVTVTTVSLGQIDPPKYNLTVQAGRARDLVLPGGSTFNNGVAIRATTQYAVNSVQDPGQDQIFVNGTYAKETSTTN